MSDCPIATGCKIRKDNDCVFYLTHKRCEYFRQHTLYECRNGCGSFYAISPQCCPVCGSANIITKLPEKEVSNAEKEKERF